MSFTDRTQTGIDPRQIEHGWDVFGPDGEKVGDVAEVGSGYLVVSKGFFFPKDRYVPFAAITGIEHDRVDLNVTKADLDDGHWDGPPEADDARRTRPRFADDVAADRAHDAEGGRTLELREEELRVDKATREAGAVELRKEVVAEQKTIDVPVTREEVVIERRPVDRAEGERMGSGEIGEGEEIRIPVREEQVTVEKTPVVREEVSIGKRRVTETERVSDTVRREEAVVDHDEDVDVRHRQANVPHAEERRHP